jgi:hypothetical protein
MQNLVYVSVRKIMGPILFATTINSEMCKAGTSGKRVPSSSILLQSQDHTQHKVHASTQPPNGLHIFIQKKKD